MDAQRAADTAILKGKQERIRFGPQPKKNRQRLMKNARGRDAYKPKTFGRNFYALDTETTGLNKDELVQVAAVLYQRGKEVKHHNAYFMPKGKFTQDAININGITKAWLRKIGAEAFSNGASEILLHFLNEHSDLPIVAHGVRHDRDRVLKPAFEKVDNLGQLPMRSRWRCTVAMSKQLPGLCFSHLNEVLEYCGFDRRDEEYHCALKDCRLAAKVYMAMMNMSIEN